MINETQKSEIVAHLRGWLDSTHNLSQNKLAKMAGVSSATISNILNHKWDSIGESMWLQLRDIIPGYNPLIETNNHKRMMLIYQEALVRPSYRIIDGHAGAGKTFTAEYFSRVKGAQVVYVKVTGAMTTRDFVIELHRQLRNSIPTGTQQQMLMDVCSAIRSRRDGNSNILLIVDECENFKVSGLALIKALYDEVNRQCSIVLLGANNFYDLIQQKAYACRTPYTQLHSRFGSLPLILAPFTLDDSVRKFCEAKGITGETNFRELIRFARDYRTLDSLIRRVYDYVRASASAQNETIAITPSIINYAATS